MASHNTIKTLPIQCHSMFLRKEWVSQYKKIWNEIQSQLFGKLATEPIKKEGRYVNGKLKTWKECIKTNFHGQDVPYNMHCNATAVLKIDSVYEQGKTKGHNSIGKTKGYNKILVTNTDMKIGSNRDINRDHEKLTLPDVPNTMIPEARFDPVGTTIPHNLKFRPSNS